MLVMLFVLGIASVLTYSNVSTMLKSNAEKHIGQTAIQANGRLDALIAQIDTITTQIATNEYIQELLLSEVEGAETPFSARQSLLSILGSYQSYVTGIKALELYSNDYQRLFPLNDIPLTDTIDQEWILAADRGKGELVWLGIDPGDSSSVLALKRVSLVDRWFSSGGFLMLRLDKAYFQFDEQIGGEAGESILLVDTNQQPITTNFNLDSGLDLAQLLGNKEKNISINGSDYIEVKQYSETTGWTLVFFTPVSYVTNGISTLRTAILVSGAIGVLLFLIMSLILSTMITRPIFKLIKAMRGARFGVLQPNPMFSNTMEINELNNSYNQMVENMNELIRVVYEKEILQSRTELKALQAQINPHFLFNTLEAFYWSLEEKGEEELANLVVSMSSLFRYTISTPNQDEWVTIEDELAHIRRYLQLMDIRLADRLTWSIDASEFKHLKIPKLLIQPLVENAIRHGVENMEGPGEVIISVEPANRDGYVRITVRDNGPGMEEDTLRGLWQAMEGGKVVSSKGTGVGVVNVRQRLRLYYDGVSGGRHELEVISRPGEGTSVSFEIPSEYGGPL
ncbi:sensor histidine kinase [Paenibacillus sp. MSJ-6]|uniref:Sensor histidine kinase n=2 Tax=Paenibacillus brevis TaxID=2841508 RepID=A0ABS6FR48_9BACL|nr:sensor histidine kinase [Paenibacillus brevis]MBU5672715.1 sensor histidine kinase [Paenibacillus brevis]